MSARFNGRFRFSKLEMKSAISTKDLFSAVLKNMRSVNLVFRPIYDVIILIGVEIYSWNKEMSNGFAFYWSIFVFRQYLGWISVSTEVPDHVPVERAALMLKEVFLD